MTPTARTLKHYRNLGFIAASVEKWLPPRGTMEFGQRIDVWGFGDVLIAKPGWGVALVQCTSRSGGNYAAHKANILAIPELRVWKESGGRVLLVGWGKRGPRGKQKLWQIREEEL